MILMYHKVDIITPTMWWVTPATLEAQLAQIGSRKFVHLDDYDPSNGSHVVVTFDDAYENVYRHAVPILERKRIPFEVFVIGDRVGEWNDFDVDEPLTRFATFSQLQEMAARGGRIQWHTRSHRDLREVAPGEVGYEMSVPEKLTSTFPPPHFGWLAYPFGEHDRCIEDAARQRFAGAVSVKNGSAGEKLRLNRILVTERTKFSRANAASTDRT